tara:strand:+ start:271 stop:858 length:588 start_codon:yes stop_codon:yes gene_type:complete
MKKKVQLNSFWFGNILILLAFSHYSKASVCGVLPKLSLEQCGHYNLIAFGKIESDLDCENERVSFNAISVFKGSLKDKIVDLYTSCSGSGLPFTQGEYWLVYGVYNNAQELKLSICGHSRKQISKGEIDYQTEVRGSSFFEDLSFLKQHFSLKIPGKKELSAKKYEKFDPKLVPVFLGIGLLFMVLGYFVMKKLK